MKVIHCTMMLTVLMLNGCGAGEMNALELRPLSTYAINQDQGVPLNSTLKQQLLDYCERQPTDVLPSRRAEVASITFRHPFYDELGSKTVKYWKSGLERYVSCSNSDEQGDRVFRTAALEAFEKVASPAVVETDVGEVVSFVPEADVQYVEKMFRINESHETIIKGSVFRYETPDNGSLDVTYHVLQDGEVLDRAIEPSLFVFESGNNQGLAFLTKLADHRIALQMGTGTSWKRTVLPSLFTGEYVRIHSLAAISNLETQQRQLLQRIILSDGPIEGGTGKSSLQLSERYGTVIEVWGLVRRPVASELTAVSLRSKKTRLATYETNDKTAHLGGPSTHELFQLLSNVKATEHAPSGKRHGTLVLYEQLTEQRFDVWVESGKDELQLIDVETKRAYAIDKTELEALLDTYI